MSGRAQREVLSTDRRARHSGRRPGLTIILLLLAPPTIAAPTASLTGNGPPIRVASKTFTESVVLGEVVTQFLEASGVKARHQSGFGGTRLLWDALVDGAIDIYPEYTGTIIEEILAGTPRPSPTGSAPGVVAPAIAPWVREALAARGVGVIGPLGFNNTYAVGVTSATARRLGLNRISDLRAHPALRFGFSSEFMSRQDGWPALRARYDLPQTDAKGLDHDLAYRGIASGAIDAMDLYATDPEIEQYGLRVLEDDLRLFPRYDAVLLYRTSRPWGRGLEALSRLVGRVDATTMAALNARAKLQHVPEAEVAAVFLRSALGVRGGGDAQSNRPGVRKKAAWRARERR